jgi:predicted metal-binding membrane protein
VRTIADLMSMAAAKGHTAHTPAAIKLTKSARAPFRMIEWVVMVTSHCCQAIAPLFALRCGAGRRSQARKGEQVMADFKARRVYDAAQYFIRI